MNKQHVTRKKTYTVRCADGCMMPLPRSVRVVEGMRPRVFTPETIITVEDSNFVRRRIGAGDFVEVGAAKEDKPAKSSKRTASKGGKE